MSPNADYNQMIGYLFKMFGIWPLRLINDEHNFEMPYNESCVMAAMMEDEVSSKRERLLRIKWLAPLRNSVTSWLSWVQHFKPEAATLKIPEKIAGFRERICN